MQRLSRVVKLTVVAALAGAMLWALSAPAYAPPIYEIAFVQGGDIWICDREGANFFPVAITPGVDEASPSWDTNQLRLVFTRGDEVFGPSDIVMYDLNTALETTVTANGRSSHPSIRGNLVSYVREVTMSARAVDQIYTKNLGSGVYKKLTNFGPHSDFGGDPATIRHTAFTPHGEAVSFLFGSHWYAHRVRAVRKTGGPVLDVDTYNPPNGNFSWSPASVTLYYSWILDNHNQNTSIFKRRWPSSGVPPYEATVFAGGAPSWHSSPAVGHFGLSVAYQFQAGEFGTPTIRAADSDAANDHELTSPGSEPAWLNDFSASLGTPAAVNRGALPKTFSAPGHRTKLRFRVASKQTVMMRVTCYIYDSAGNLVRKRGPADKVVGNGFFYWNGKNNAGAYVPAGVYHYRVRATDASGMRKTSTSKNVTVL